MRHLSRRSTFVALLVVTACLGLMAVGLAAMPPAGTAIGNQASATYTDASGVARTVTSNAVITHVQQVAGLTLTSDMVKQANPNSQVVFPLVLTNTGNGTDSFNLSFANSGGDDFNFTTITFYRDANGDGVADNTTPITGTGDLASGAVFHFIAVATVPSTPLAGQAGIFTVTATSTYAPTEAATATEQVNVTGNAVINVTKSISQHTAIPTNNIIYTLTYTNSGNATATNLTLTDIIPDYLSYVADSGRWSGSGITVLTDADDGLESGGIQYRIVGKTITVVIPSVPVGSGTVSFHVTVDAGTPPGIIYNQADVAYDDGGTPVNHITDATNRAPLTILQTAAVDATGNTVANATQGATVAFANAIQNLGNGTDSFEITVNNVNFPAGTTFMLYQSDGATPLLSSDGDGIPDTGPLAAGATFSFVLRATLPGPATGGPYTVNFTAVSNYDGTVADTAADVLTTITTSTVDMTYNLSIAGGAVAANGLGAGPEAAALANPTTNPNTTVTFDLYVNNTSTIPDSYDLQASTDSTFAALTLPTGWSIVFRNTSGAVITRTNVIAAGGNQAVTATVTIPAGTAPGVRDIYFRGISPTTATADELHLAVTVNTVHNVSLIPNNAGEVYPGGAVTYGHTLTNTGNVTEVFRLATGHTGAGFTSSVYRDTNSNGAIDVGEPVISSTDDLTLTAGQSMAVLVKVYTPAGAAAHTTDVCTLTATAVGLSASATDTTTVISADLIILKEQALDADRNGAPDGAFTTAPVNALPGACIRYKITITNNGTADAANVVISDATPDYTTYHLGDGTDGTVNANGAACWTDDGGVTFHAIAVNPDGSFSVTFPVVTPGETIVIYFSVQIEQ